MKDTNKHLQRTQKLEHEGNADETQKLDVPTTAVTADEIAPVVIDAEPSDPVNEGEEFVAPVDTKEEDFVGPPAPSGFDPVDSSVD